MQGKVVVLTGGTSGIGEAAALNLAKMGARLVLVARDVSRAEATLERLQQISLGTTQAIRHTAHLADLSLVAETRRLEREIATAEPCIDVLINNAGRLLGGGSGKGQRPVFQPMPRPLRHAKMLKIGLRQKNYGKNRNGWGD